MTSQMDSIPPARHHTPQAGKTSGKTSGQKKQKWKAKPFSTFLLFLLGFELRHHNWLFNTFQLFRYFFRLLMVLVQFSNTSSKREAFSKNPKSQKVEKLKNVHVDCTFWLRLGDFSIFPHLSGKGFKILIRHRAILLFLDPHPLARTVLVSSGPEARELSAWAPQDLHLKCQIECHTEAR